ncbi:MAG: alpha/beta hydrolase [Holophaga sp.]|nr:alpha/beta hydrolase [Holophaga sp.]
MDAVTFTFRNRDLVPGPPSTLGGWESWDVVAVLNRLAAEGVPREKMLLVGTSQGAGVALLALEQVEQDGKGPLGGALLESPYEDLVAAAKNHLRGTLGRAEWLLRPGEHLALARAGHLAHFKPMGVSPKEASKKIQTPIALLTGDADDVTPLQGVKRISVYHPDLTIVLGAHHLEAGSMVAGGWKAWAWPRLGKWGFKSSGPEGM